jgi:hypothetical protein
VRLPWGREDVFTQPRPVSTKTRELEAAKEILSEVFHVRPVDVDEMLLKRLGERNPSEKSREGLWPATFCLVE